MYFCEQVVNTKKYVQVPFMWDIIGAKSGPLLPPYASPSLNMTLQYLFRSFFTSIPVSYIDISFSLSLFLSLPLKAESQNFLDPVLAKPES